MKVSAINWKWPLGIAVMVIGAWYFWPKPIPGPLDNPAVSSDTGYTTVYQYISSCGEVAAARYSKTYPYSFESCIPVECCPKGEYQHPNAPDCLEGKSGSFDAVVVGECTSYYKHGPIHNPQTYVCKEGNCPES